MSDRRRKLTEAQVAEIRTARDRGAKMPALARKYKLSIPSIWAILKERSYKKA